MKCSGGAIAEGPYAAPPGSYYSRTRSELSQTSEDQIMPNPEALCDLARAICGAVHARLSRPIRPGDDHQIGLSARLGFDTNQIDLACNHIVEDAASKWSRDTGISLSLAGEGLGLEALYAGLPAGKGRVICVVDSLDGTQHWLRGKNLYCTALSVFLRSVRSGGRAVLALSAVVRSDGRLLLATESPAEAWVEAGSSRASLEVPDLVAPSLMSDAHVCTSCRRPDHYAVLLEHLAQGSPFRGLYTRTGSSRRREGVRARSAASATPRRHASRLISPERIASWPRSADASC